MTDYCVAREVHLVGDRSTEQQNVWLRFVCHVVHPSLALLNPKLSPLGLGHEVRLGNKLGKILRQHNVAVFVLVVEVFVRIVNILGRHPVI